MENDTPVGEGGKECMCPSQNLVDMYDLADGTSPLTTEYDDTGAPVYNSTTSNGVPAPTVKSECVITMPIRVIIVIHVWLPLFCIME